MQHHEDILHSLTSMLAAQQTMNQTQTIVTQELREFNQHQVAINQHVTTTLARIETLLARIIPQQDNGTDA